MPGAFVPHIRMMDTGYQDTELACEFGLPYVVVQKPRPFDTATLNYNWQIWETKAYSLYGGMKEVCRNVRCTSFFVHHYTNRFIISKQRSFEDFFDLCVPCT